MKEKDKNHPVEITGRKLRKLMSWINSKEQNRHIYNLMLNNYLAGVLSKFDGVQSAQVFSACSVPRRLVVVIMLVIACPDAMRLPHASVVVLKLANSFGIDSKIRAADAQTAAGLRMALPDRGGEAAGSATSGLRIAADRPSIWKERQHLCGCRPGRRKAGRLAVTRPLYDRRASVRQAQHRSSQRHLESRHSRYAP